MISLSSTYHNGSCKQSADGTVISFWIDLMLIEAVLMGSQHYGLSGSCNDSSRMQYYRLYLLCFWFDQKCTAIWTMEKSCLQTVGPKYFLTNGQDERVVVLYVVMGDWEPFDKSITMSWNLSDAHPWQGISDWCSSYYRVYFWFGLKFVTLVNEGAQVNLAVSLHAHQTMTLAL